MTAILVDALLGWAVLAAWLGAAGFLRLRSALDRMHCAAFVNAAAGLALVLAAFVSDGASDRALKILLMVAISLVAGAATSHAAGRALLLRGSAPEAEGPARLAAASDRPRVDGTRG